MAQEMYTTNPALVGAVAVAGTALFSSLPKATPTAAELYGWSAAGLFLIGVGWFGALSIRKVDFSSMVSVAVVGDLGLGLGAFLYRDSSSSLLFWSCLGAAVLLTLATFLMRPGDKPPSSNAAVPPQPPHDAPPT